MDKNTYSLLETYMLSCMDDSAHDKEHVYRVLYNAMRIAQKEENAEEEEIDLEFEKMCSDANTKLKEIGFKITKREMTTRFFHFVKSDYQNSYVVKTLAKSAKETSGRTLIPSGAVLSDLSLIVKNGSPNAVAFGVGRAFDVYGGAHQRDENISCDNLLEFAKIMGSFLMNY